MKWSTKILILYLAFVSLILTLVFTCFGHKTELEFKDYYARELRFQEQLDAQRNAESLSEPIAYRIVDRSVIIDFPEALRSDLKGSVLLLRPSDASGDKLVEIAADGQGSQVINGLSKGLYKMRIEASSQGTPYFLQAVLTIR